MLFEVPFGGGVTEVWEKATVTPAGTPEAVRLTGLLKPLIDVMVTVELPTPPAGMVKVVGEADIAKSGAEGIVRVSVSVSVTPPPVADTVRV